MDPSFKFVESLCFKLKDPIQPICKWIHFWFKMDPKWIRLNPIQYTKWIHSDSQLIYSIDSFLNSNDTLSGSILESSIIYDMAPHLFKRFQTHLISYLLIYLLLLFINILYIYSMFKHFHIHSSISFLFCFTLKFI